MDESLENNSHFFHFPQSYGIMIPTISMYFKLKRRYIHDNRRDEKPC